MRTLHKSLFLLLASFPVFALHAVCADHGKKSGMAFQTSDRCMVCHNGLTTSTGEDVSIGFHWRASVMANASRDPYWQASSRRETIDHPESQAFIEDDCSVCHMPITRYEAKLRGKEGEIFSHLPFDPDHESGQQAEDGVTCSVCHQIGKEKLGSRESFNGGFVVNPPDSHAQHPEYGPFDIQLGQQRIMRTSSGGFLPNKEDHIRKSELCATCHTLYTKALGRNGEQIGILPEQVPYQEWLHSDYRDKQSCQECHMPEVQEAVPIAKVLGVPRQGLHQHTFVAANFLLQNMLNRYRDDLSVEALPEELTSAAKGTIAYLQAKAAHIDIDSLTVSAGRLQADVFVENLGGHKFPTAYPSRRAWLHFTVQDRDHKTIFESGGLNPDGSIRGNDNDADPARFEPHYTEITNSGQVEIYEDILKDQQGHVTTGLLSAVGYIKDNRILPHGFDKTTADKDIAVYGAALNDAGFTDRGSRVRYSVAIPDAQGPLEVTAELWYEPIGYRWANNLKVYGKAAEPRRFNSFYDAMGPGAAVMLTRASILLPGH
ncbi:MAG: hypothetical protein M3Y57_03665 [Acidobacteriota bacterium]|nr:hypothetical protein [Acidobacteriota bacterium]